MTATTMMLFHKRLEHSRNGKAEVLFIELMWRMPSTIMKQNSGEAPN